jgi:phthalate 4,5-cis-dihydrodiol dehydrogenase
MGNPKPPSESAQRYGQAKRRLVTAQNSAEETALKAARNYGGNLYTPADIHATSYQHFGPVIVSCEKGDIRLTPSGIWVYGPENADFVALPAPKVPRAEVIKELCQAIQQQTPLTHTGEWARATTEVCLGILQAAETGQSVSMAHQIAVHHGH